MMPKRRWVVGVSSLLGAAACSKDPRLAPLLPPCTASANAINLDTAAYLAIDPAADSGCVTFAANPSVVDSIEYLLVPQSAAGTFGDSARFQLQTVTLAAAPPLVQAVIPSSSPRVAAVQFDGYLRHLARSGAAGVAALARSAAAPAPTPAAPQPAGPPSPGSLRRFTVCANLTCSKFQAVTARVSTVGTHIPIYVDTLAPKPGLRSEEHTSELQSHSDLVCRLLLEKKKKRHATTDRAADHGRPRSRPSAAPARD